MHGRDGLDGRRRFCQVVERGIVGSINLTAELFTRVKWKCQVRDQDTKPLYMWLTRDHDVRF